MNELHVLTWVDFDHGRGESTQWITPFSFMTFMLFMVKSARVPDEGTSSLRVPNTSFFPPSRKLPSSSPEMNRIKLDLLDQEKSIEQDEYKTRLKQQQLELLKRQLVLRERKGSLIIVLEGPDAAGKGGAIKRITENLDPRLMRVYSIIKPTPEEYQHHYMWRFWNKLPAYGTIAIFDRSWYGRVLVERVEGFATDAEWKRAYREINEFEQQLIDDGSVIVKLYLQITKDEQLQRFRRREADPYKHWKISDEDWRNRRHWEQHNAAAEDMFEKTSTEIAPWTIIPANYKWYARIRALRTVNAALTHLLES